MTDSLQDTISWGIGTGITLGVAGMAMNGMKSLYPKQRVRYINRRSRRKKRR